LYRCHECAAERLNAGVMKKFAELAPSPAWQGRVGVGLCELAAMFEFTARLLHPTPALPYYT